MEMKKRVLALLCATVLMLSGCGGKKGSELEASKIDFKGYPIQTEEKLTLWIAHNAALSQVVDNFAKTPFAIELEKRTGVKVEYTHPVLGQETTSMGLLIASDRLPDMMCANWATYNGGPQKQLDEGVIIPLNDLIDKYAPNLKKYLEEHPEIDKLIKTEDGTYYAFPFIRGGERLLNSGGQMIRRDLLEKYGLDMPKTVEDLEEILKTFKENGVKYPLSTESYSLYRILYNFNTTDTFYLDKNGKVVYGPLTSNYKEALETISKWYKDGLIDPNFVSADTAEIRTKVINGEVGVTTGAGGSFLGACLDAWKTEGKNYDLVGFPYTAYNGQKNIITSFESQYPGYGSVAITSSCKNPELAVRYLDFGYSEEGSFFYNFGVEGEGHNLVDGEPVFSDNVLKNPEGLTIAQAMMMYMRSSTSGPFIQDVRYIDQYYAHEQQKESLDVWTADYDEKIKYNLPRYMRNAEEDIEFNTIMLDIEEYVNTCRDGFVVGKMSFKDWNEFTKKLKDLGIDRAIQIQQKAFDRYNK